MNIDTIKNGYVIDHITAGKAIEIYISSKYKGKIGRKIWYYL